MIRALVTALALAQPAEPAPAPAPVAGAEVSAGTFEAPLAEHGEWVVVGGHGRVWHPRGVAAGWRPYYDGRWEWTDDGWMWVSEEPWGWATYHYGRWAWQPPYGWVWVPGFEYAPAWVVWRHGGEHIGWAPMQPGWAVGYAGYPVVYEHWTFVPANRFVGVRVHEIAVAPAQVRVAFHAAEPAPPARVFVEGRIGHPVVAARIVAAGSPAEVARLRAAGQVVVFHPGWAARHEVREVKREVHEERHEAVEARERRQEEKAERRQEHREKHHGKRR